ncbi:MAG TPA: hypothetical protein VHL59_00525, partial [Thermoanaerobaculia bacterium]|nr:hypothetical protein [Thermoanaerobaculia bacterium]
ADRSGGLRARRSTENLPVAELALALFFFGAIIAFAGTRQWLSVPFLSIFASGYGYVAFVALKERLTPASSVV